MKASDIREKSVEELDAELLKLRKEQFNLNVQKSTGQLGQTHLLKDNKKAIARVKTLLTQKAAGK